MAKETKKNQEEVQNQSAEQAKPQNQVQFKQVETRLLGPMSLNVQSNTEDNAPAKGIDLILPAFSWAVEMRLYLPVPQEELTGKATEGYIRIDQDVENFIFSPPSMRISVRFPENFYEKYGKYIEDQSNFKIMAYVLGFIDRAALNNISAQRAAEQNNQEQGSLQESNEEQNAQAAA